MSGTVYPVPPAAIALPTLALLTLIIDAPPFIWHIRNRNFGASSLIFWILLSNLMNFVNALIWPTDDIFRWWQGYGLCDIEAKLQLALGFGIIGSLACIMRSLALVLNTKRTILSPSKAQRRTKIAIDFLLCFGAAIYSMAVHYIVQPNRYDIFAISGCSWSFDFSWPSMVLIIMWPPILCLVAGYYSGMLLLAPSSMFFKLTGL
ncbi:pheromone a factor receptor, partial [Lecanoromycetidae sp. Uapishka_2]